MAEVFYYIGLLFYPVSFLMWLDAITKLKNAVARNEKARDKYHEAADEYLETKDSLFNAGWDSAMAFVKLELMNKYGWSYEQVDRFVNEMEVNR